MTSTPAAEPNSPKGHPAPDAPGKKPLTPAFKALVGIVITGVITIATLGFIGSYHAVRDLAQLKGFGDFAHVFPIAVDAGIIAFLALDLVLTWFRIGFPLLRYTAWGLTVATIGFNAAVAWPDKLGASMHGVIPVLFVIAVEAARHAICRIAAITADKHIEGPPFSRWLLNPLNTFTLWRRQRMWGIRTWDQVLELERERRIYIGQLRKQYGRGWRRKANADQLLVLSLAKDGMSVTDALALPAREAEKRRAEEDRIAREKQAREDERRERDLAYQREQQRLADERRDKELEHQREQERLERERLQREEDDRRAREREALALEEERKEAARRQQIADAEAAARLAAIQREQADAAAAEERRRRAEEIETARRLREEQEKAATAAKARQDAEEKARLEAERKLELSLRAAENLRAATATATASPAVASASAAAATRPASVTAKVASPASPATATAASASTTTRAASTPAATTSASAVDIRRVVETYQLLQEQLGKSPSDEKLGQALGVSRSRAQQLRTAAIEKGHTELAKPLRIAS